MGSSLPNAVQFNDKQEFVVFGDCNECGGTYLHGIDALRIDVQGCSRRFCEKTEEGDFLDALEGSWRWTRVKDTLRISYDGDGPGNGSAMELTLATVE